MADLQQLEDQIVSLSLLEASELVKKLEARHKEHIAVYGPDNHLRLTGLHETQSIDKFNYGVGNRGASVRVPISLPISALWKYQGIASPPEPEF